MHGIKRVLVFCTLTTVLPTMLLVIPLYLRHSFYASVAYAVTESDILEITDGISTIFCSAHTLQMNGTFNAFQMSHRPEVTSYRKHIRLKKSMYLPDDTLEYWGFYLLKGATVALSVCSRFQGASILVVKGERNLRTCGMLEHNDNKQLTRGIFLPEANRQVKITFESNAQEINSGESTAEFNNKIVHDTEANGSIQNATHIATTESQMSMNVQNIRSNKNHITNVDNNMKSSKERIQEDELETLYQTAETYVQKHLESSQNGHKWRKLRHAKRRHHKTHAEELKSGDKHESNKSAKHSVPQKRNVTVKNRESVSRRDADPSNDRSLLLEKLKLELTPKVADDNDAQEEDEVGREERPINKRVKRNQELVKPPSLLDQGIKHGGNAGRNGTEPDDESSVSSFENGLFNCYGGSILLAREFEPSDQCTDVSYLLSGKHMQTRHNVIEDGYYYYIFYSDNDIVANDIHALFDIYKPTFQYENVTKSCINQTECSFALTLMSPDRVIVEIPTKDGIDHEIDDTSLLISICHPRMEVYIIFPIAVLFFILTCAFM